MFGHAEIVIPNETMRQWADEFLPRIASTQAVKKHQFLFGYDEVAKAHCESCSALHEFTFDADANDNPTRVTDLQLSNDA